MLQQQSGIKYGKKKIAIGQMKRIINQLNKMKKDLENYYQIVYKTSFGQR